MKVGWIILGLAAAYLVGHLLMLYRNRNRNLPPPGTKGASFDDEEDDWPKPR